MKSKSIIQAAPMPTGTLNRIRYSLLDEALGNIRRVLEGGEPLTAVQKKIVCDIADLTRHHVVRRTLTLEQISAAFLLRKERRIAVLANGEPDPRQESAWYEAVLVKVQELGISGVDETNMFYDIAGVAS